MKRNAWIFVFFSTMLFFIQCAPKIAKQTSTTQKQQQGSSTMPQTGSNMPQNNGQPASNPGSTNISIADKQEPDPERVNELSDAEKSEYQAMMMQNGKLLYSQNCGKCHSFYEPGSRSAAEWTKVMESMAKKAQLDETGKMHVLTYLHYGAKK